jgi:cell division protein FtsB
LGAPSAALAAHPLRFQAGLVECLENWVSMSARTHAARAPAGRRRVQRRVGRRTGPSRIRWDRVGRVALTLVLFGVLVSYLNPLVNLVDAWRDSGANKEQLTHLRARHEKLEAKVRAADSSVVVEREARKLGMVRPGERAYVIRNLGG